jgi:soluble lytic murein transglycosylase-like protein
VVDVAGTIRAQIAEIDRLIAAQNVIRQDCYINNPGTTLAAQAARRNCEAPALTAIAEYEKAKAELNAQLAGTAPVTTVPGTTPPGTTPISTNPNVFIPQANITPEGAALVANNTNSYAAIIEAELARQGVPISPELVRAIMSAESGGNPNAKSPAGAVGLMQVLPSTARQYFPGMTDAQIEQELRNPQTNIRVGVQVLNANLNNPNVRTDNTNDLIASYNSGAGNQLNAAGKKPALADSSDCPGARAYECSINPGGLEETRNYVARVNYYTQYYTNQNRPANNNANSGTNIPNTVNPADLPDGNVDLNY